MVEDFITDADFVGAGEGQMTMQSGSERIVLSVTVLEAP
jgi:glycerate kinase